MKTQSINNVKINSIKDIIINSAEKFGDDIAFYEKVKGSLVGYSYKKLRDDVFALGTKLLSMGLRDKHIAIIGENSYNWIVAYLAIINGVGVAVPLDKELNEEDLAELLIKSDSEVLIFSKILLSGIDVIKDKCKGITQYISLNEQSHEYLDIESLISEGENLIINGDNSFDDANLNIDGLSVLMFTSGTTGPNKGVMISQRNLISNVIVGDKLFGKYKSNIAVLPFHHIYQNVCGILIPINSGILVYINDSLKYLSQNLKSFKPELATVVPIFLETMYKSINVELEKMKLEKVFGVSLKVSNFLRNIGVDLRGLWFRQVHNYFGGNLRTIVCGGAFLRPELVKAYRDIGIRVINGYGITECTPLVSVNTEYITNDKSVGQIIDCSEVMIFEANEDGIGEILVKGSNVMIGYYKDEESTLASFIDEWYRTGDYGYKDEFNNLYITGRKKNLIVLSNGKNVHPEELEEYIFKNMPYVKEAVVYSDTTKNGNEVILAAIYLDPDMIAKYNIENVDERVKDDLRKLNMKLPIFKQINKVYIREEEFIKNASKKIIRQKFLEEVSNYG